ncbi:UPF0182 family protein [Rhodococcus sp. 27YEA15]|uniref:UPF0182 family protein n=1 Tax=Rhodococcus sp. 27YEA15 TaxID=3156259 RepID=UPI003C7D098F
MRPPAGIPSLSRRSRILLVIAVVIAALLLVGPRLISMYTDWLWFGEVDYRGVFTKVLLTRISLFFVVGIIVAAVVWLAMLLAYRSRPVFVPVSGPNDPIARYRTTVMSRLRLFGVVIPIAIGILSGLIAQSNWVTVQLFFNGGSFGITDPQFNVDVGFYTFDLPFYRFVLNWLFVSILLAFVANLLTHYIFGGVKLAGRGGSFTTAARVQLAILAGVFVLFKAVAYWFDRYSLLSSGRKEPTFTGAGYTDINAVLPAKLILMSIAIICALAFFTAIFTRDLRVPAMGVALLVLSSVLVGAVWPMVVEQFSVKPNAASKESTYIERNIEATRQAYGITSDNVEYVDYPGVGKSEPQNVAADRTTIANTRLLDPTILSPTFTAQRQLKNFYGFPQTLNIDRYEQDGQLRDFVVAARELSPANLTGNQTDWINKHTVYTHGNGFVAAQANEVTVVQGDNQNNTGGYPIYTVSDLSTTPDNENLKLDNPRSYYGEVISQSDADYSIVGSVDGEGPREYDTDTSKYTYTGSGGVPIGNWINRLAFAAKYTERNILFSSAIGDNSKIIFKRDPKERVKAVAPWLTTDGAAYPAVVDGKMQWIIDGYTTAQDYPYAQRSSLDGLVEDSIDQTTGRLIPRQEVSYIRNSVKATVDAYDGTVTLYQYDENDPVLKAWMGVFPDTVKPKSDISDDLQAHLRYPEDLFKVQREMLAKYHVDDPSEFFTNNAFWSVPSDPTIDTSANQPPYYVLVGNKDTAQPDFRLTSPMVGFNRELLSAHISVANDKENYGKFTVLQLPTDTQTQGPQQAQSAMTSDSRVASEVSLLKQSNKIQYGNLLTLPIAEGGILYVEPLYSQRNSQNAFPQLARVLVSFSDTNGIRIGYAPTVSEAISQIWPGAGAAATVTPPAPTDNGEGNTPTTAPATPPPPPAANTPVTPEQTAAALATVDKALADLKTAQTGGDFAAYGRALDALQKAVDAYQNLGK